MRRFGERSEGGWGRESKEKRDEGGEEERKAKGKGAGL